MSRTIYKAQCPFQPPPNIWARWEVRGARLNLCKDRPLIIKAKRLGDTEPTLTRVPKKPGGGDTTTLIYPSHPHRLAKGPPRWEDDRAWM
jgi:hypothetical protein